MRQCRWFNSATVLNPLLCIFRLQNKFKIHYYLVFSKKRERAIVIQCNGSTRFGFKSQSGSTPPITIESTSGYVVKQHNHFDSKSIAFSHVIITIDTQVSHRLNIRVEILTRFMTFHLIDRKKRKIRLIAEIPVLLTVVRQEYYSLTSGVNIVIMRNLRIAEILYMLKRHVFRNMFVRCRILKNVTYYNEIREGIPI